MFRPPWVFSVEWTYWKKKYTFELKNWWNIERLFRISRCNRVWKQLVNNCFKVPALNNQNKNKNNILKNYKSYNSVRVSTSLGLFRRVQLLKIKSLHLNWKIDKMLGEFPRISRLWNSRPLRFVTAKLSCLQQLVHRLPLNSLPLFSHLFYFVPNYANRSRQTSCWFYPNSQVPPSQFDSAETSSRPSRVPKFLQRNVQPAGRRETVH